jgi:hypothetical protein
MLESTPVSAVHAAGVLVVVVVVPLLAVVVVVVVNVHVQLTLTLVAPLTVAPRFSTCVITSVAVDWLIATVTVFAPLLLLPQPASHAEANVAASATQLVSFPNLIPPASHA